MYDLLQHRVPDLDERLRKQKASAYHGAACEYKQERRIDGLIKVKEEILSGSVPILETRRLEYYSLLPLIRQFIR